MEKKSIGKNYIYNLIVQVVSILIPLLTAPYVSRVLTVEGVGRFSVTFSNVTYFVLAANLGTGVYAQREVAGANNDCKKIDKIFSEVFVLRLIMALISASFYMILYVFSGRNSLVLIQAINIISVVFDITWLYQGLEEFKKTSLRTTVTKLLFVAFLFIFVKNESHVGLYALGYGGMTLLGNLSMWICVPKYVKFVKPDFKHMFKRLGPAFVLFIPAMATQVYTVLDKTMIGVFTTTNTENGLYESAEKISRISLTIYTAYGTVIAPRVTLHYQNGDKEKVKEILGTSIRVMWALVLPMLAGLFAVASNLIPWFYGADYEGSIVILQIFAFLLIPVGLSNVLAVQYLVPCKKQNIFAVSVVCGAILNFSLNMFLIPRYYSIGAAAASVTSECVITLIQYVYVVYFDKFFKTGELLLPALKYIIMSAVMFVPVYLLSGMMTPSVINTVILMVLGITIYGGCLLLTGDPLLKRRRK